MRDFVRTGSYVTWRRVPKMSATSIPFSVTFTLMWTSGPKESFFTHFLPSSMQVRMPNAQYEYLGERFAWTRPTMSS